MLKAFLNIFFRDSDGIDELETRHIIEAAIITAIIIIFILLMP
jgi:hypothetical protein